MFLRLLDTLLLEECVCVCVQVNNNNKELGAKYIVVRVGGHNPNPNGGQLNCLL